MYENIDSFRIASGLVRHAGERQSAIAANIANADTPGYRAHDIADFASSYDRWDWATRPFEADGRPLKTTRPEHLAGQGPLVLFNRVDAPDETSPNGNTVSLEDQMVKSASAQSEHDLATGIYRASLDFLRTSIGRGR